MSFHLSHDGGTNIERGVDASQASRPKLRHRDLEKIHEKEHDLFSVDARFTARRIAQRVCISVGAAHPILSCHLDLKRKSA